MDSFSLSPTQTHLILLYIQQKWPDEVPQAILQMDCTSLEESLWLSSGAWGRWKLKSEVVTPIMMMHFQHAVIALKIFCR